MKKIVLCTLITAAPLGAIDIIEKVSNFVLEYKSPLAFIAGACSIAYIHSSLGLKTQQAPTNSQASKAALEYIDAIKNAPDQIKGTTKQLKRFPYRSIWNNFWSHNQIIVQTEERSNIPYITVSINKQIIAQKFLNGRWIDDQKRIINIDTHNTTNCHVNAAADQIALKLLCAPI